MIRQIYNRVVLGSLKSGNDILSWDLDNHLSQVDDVYNSIQNGRFYYEWVIDELASLPNLSLRPLCTLFDNDDDTVARIGLRHDVDMDPVAAVRCSRYLAYKGIRGSFYLLHTNPYFGTFVSNRFIINSELSKWVRDLVVAGSEVGLHHDTLHLYRNVGVNGLDRLARDISLLRSYGAQVYGVVAHNSGPLYGAENYEIFEEHLLWKRRVPSRKYWKFPLGKVRKDMFGLKYEGTFTQPKAKMDKSAAAAFFADSASANVRSPEWMRKFLLDNPACDYEVDYQIWLIGKDSWAIAGKWQDEPVFLFDIGFGEVREFCRTLPNGSATSLIIHPEYVR